MIQIPKFHIPQENWIDKNKLNGKKLSQEILGSLKTKVKRTADSTSKQPGLVAILVGEDKASQIYVANKEKAAKNIGFYSIIDTLPITTTQEELIKKIQSYNDNPNIHGILVQLPLPAHIDVETILNNVHYSKDADGFHDLNTGKLFNKKGGTIPCTPLGMMVMLSELNISLEGKNAVILGRSNIVGKPIAQLLMDYAHCTVSICHSKTSNLDLYIQNADIIVSAMGKRHVINENQIKKNAIVLDVGIHRHNNQLKGDLDLSSLPNAPVQYYTPVPGGVGPMTIAMLLYNTYYNFQKIEGVHDV